MRSEILSYQADGRRTESDPHVGDSGADRRPGRPVPFDDIFERAN